MSMGIIESGEYNKVAGLGDVEGETVDKIELGNLKPVTSNAVAEVTSVQDFTSKITFTNWNPSGQVQLCKCGKHVVLLFGGYLASGAMSQDVNNRTIIGTVPTECRPLSIHVQATGVTVAGAPMLIGIWPNGTIDVCCPSSAEQTDWAWGSLSYFVA